MSDTPLCLSCGGKLAWYGDVSSWRHSWVPPGTLPHAAVLPREGHGFTVDVVESDVDTGKRLQVERDEIIARQQAVREALGDFPLEIERERVQLSPPKPKETGKLLVHPAPIESVREAFEDEMPNAAKSIRELLKANGWEVEQRYSRGYRPDVHQRESHTRAVDVVVLRAVRRRNREAVVACWEDSGYDVAWHVRKNQTDMIGATELRKRIKAEVYVCSTCGEPPHTHPLPHEGGDPRCFQEAP